MKTLQYILLVIFTSLFVFTTNITYGQWELINIDDIHNTNLGDVLINTNLKWNNNNSVLSNDEGGSIELGLGNYLSGSPYIDFHFAIGRAQNFNTRLWNSADNNLDLMYSNGAKTSFYSQTASNNTMIFHSGNGILGMEFWSWGIDNISLKNKSRFHFKNNIRTPYNIIDFYVDYTNPDYDQLAIKSDNTVSWGADWSWLSAYGWFGFEGPGINLNKAGYSTDPNLHSTPFIDFSYGNNVYRQRIDARIINSDENTLDFLVNMDMNASGGTKIMSIKNDGVYTTKLMVRPSWSDFVFKSEYKLKSLDEIEKYILQNGHLEGIPSEQEVNQNGVEVGEITSKLLQKIEELTLFIIEQNKKIEKLEKEFKK